MTQEPSTVSFQRERAPHAENLLTSTNSQLYAAARKGSGKHVLWARSGVGPGTVGDYRAEGYKIVDPKDVQTLERLQYYPDKKDFGVWIEIEKGADRVQTIGGMVLMWCPQDLLDELRSGHKKRADQFYRKEVKPVNQGANVDFGTEVTTTLESLSSM